MAAYNWINVEGKCPNCKQVMPIRCQTHIASSFGGDETGMFCHREYRLGDKMAWWPEGHKDFIEWREEWRGDCDDLPRDQSVEACYANCRNCGAELCVVIQFEDLRPTRTAQITLEADWPEKYTK